MLIIALAVLTLLSIIAVTFAALMRLERKATENFVNSASVELLSGSGESAVIAMLRSAPLWDGYTDGSSKQRTPWLYGIQTPFGDIRYGNQIPLETLTDPSHSSYSSDLGATYGGTASSDRFLTKIIDCNSQIYLNGDQDTTAQMLDNLGLAIQKNTDIQIDPLHTEPQMKGKKITGRDIIRFRTRLPGRRFTSKSQLKGLIGIENYEILADFVTAHAWVNPYTFRGDGREPIRAEVEGEDGISSVANLTLQANPRVEGGATLFAEPRAPINVNTAPKEVLIACLAGLGCRRAFPLTELITQQFENQNRASIDVDGTLPPTDEEITLLQVPVWVYSQPLQIEQAELIAEEIVRARKTRPFKVWRSGDKSQPGFEDFINQLPQTVFPAASSVTVINPRDPGGSYQGQVLGGGEGSGRIYGAGHNTGDRNARLAAGLAVNGANAWYFDMMRDMLKANFNPNSRINKFNPNLPALVTVDKANLSKLANEGRDKNDVQVGHTTEFCFDSKGLYEITSFAEILVGNESEPVQTFAQTKRRSIVKVFDVLHHTTQRQFEQPYSELGTSSFRDREYVSTYPDPMDALEPDTYYGSIRDGRVELSGATDARLQSVRPELRSNEFSNSSNLMLAHTFRFRKEVGPLQRMIRQQGRNAPRTRELLREVLDADYTKEGRFAKRYSRDRWKADDSSDDVANIDEPLVNTSDFNGDLQPDGLHMSMMRVNRSGTRILRFPASGSRQSPADEGLPTSPYDNTAGNLPYYRGGVSFWIKLEFSGSDPVFSGLLKATQIQAKVGVNPGDSEGTQLFIWKNTTGEIRVTRLFYHQAFAFQETGNAIPDIGEGGALEDEEYQVDQRKSHARSDLVVDVSSWRAHEWHHLVVEWDDEALAGRITARIDGEEALASSNDLGLGKFVALNEESPKDEIQIGGIHRDQAVATEGVFKFGTNVQLQSMQDIAPSLKKIPANATIDEFRTFSGVYDRGNDELGYFTRETGKYTNRFEVPFPEGIQRVRLRSFTWSVYPPMMYGGSGVRWTPQTDFIARVGGVNNSPSFVGVGDAGGDQTLNSVLSGQWLHAKGSLFGRTGSLGYQFEMRGALGQRAFGDRIVSSPVLDDVTLTYYLPSAQTLLSENLD